MFLRDDEVDALLGDESRVDIDGGLIRSDSDVWSNDVVGWSAANATLPGFGEFDVERVLSVGSTDQKAWTSCSALPR